MNLNLYPYNFWVLYAAIALAVIFLIFAPLSLYTLPASFQTQVKNGRKLLTNSLKNIQKAKK